MNIHGNRAQTESNAIEAYIENCSAICLRMYDISMRILRSRFGHNIGPSKWVVSSSDCLFNTDECLVVVCICRNCGQTSAIHQLEHQIAQKSPVRTIIVDCNKCGFMCVSCIVDSDGVWWSHGDHHWRNVYHSLDASHKSTHAFLDIYIRIYTSVFHRVSFLHCPHIFAKVG